MPRSLATGHRKVTILSVAPASFASPTIAELTAGIEASCRITADGYQMNPGGSETISEGTLCDEITPKVPTNATFDDGRIVSFRYFGPTGAAETGVQDTEAGIGDALYQALRVKGTRLWAVDRLTSRKSVDPWLPADECRVFEFITDPTKQMELTGYIKAETPLLVQKGELNGTVSGTYTAWAATTAYTLGQLRSLSTGIVKVTTAGTSGGTAPTLPTSVGLTVTDGSVVWTRID